MQCGLACEGDLAGFATASCLSPHQRLNSSLIYREHFGRSNLMSGRMYHGFVYGDYGRQVTNQRRTFIEV